MSEHRAELSWKRTSSDFSYDTYNREHVCTFPGGATLPMSATPEFKGDASCANPEEALVAALSSCHMLSFLAIASKKQLCVEEYRDHACGYLEKNSAGQMAVTKVVLRPIVEFSKDTPVDRSQIEQIHHKAHQVCFIANSVKTEVLVEPIF